ncbi:unnamed protein product [Lampetra fluviatilis]
MCVIHRPPHRVEAPGRGDSGSTVWSTGTSTQDSLRVPSPSFSQLSTSPDTGLSVLSSSVSSPTISYTRSPLSTHSSHGSPEQDSPLPSPDVATSQAFVSLIPAFLSSRSDPLPFAADRSGPPTAGVFAGRRLKEQQDMAAAVIQRCYRKYKQLTWIALKYTLYKKMTQAAILIQSKFRSYYEQKRFQQSRQAAVLIQQYYRSYKEYEKLKQTRRGTINLQQKMR